MSNGEEQLRRVIVKTMQERRRRDIALEDIDFLKRVSEEYMDICEYAIEKSYDEIDAKNALIEMLQRRTYGGDASQLLSEENEANAAAMLLHKRFVAFKQSPWSRWKKIKFRLGFHSPTPYRDIRYIEGITKRMWELSQKHADKTGEEDQNRSNIFISLNVVIVNKTV